MISNVQQYWMEISYLKEEFFLSKVNDDVGIDPQSCGSISVDGSNKEQLKQSKYIYYADEDLNKMKTQHKKEISKLKSTIATLNSNQPFIETSKRNNTLSHTSKRYHLKVKSEKGQNNSSLKSKQKQNQSPIFNSLKESRIISHLNSNQAHPKQIKRQRIPQKLLDSSILLTQNDITFTSNSQNSSQQLYSPTSIQQSTKQHSILSDFDEIFKKIKISDYLKTQNQKY